MAHNMHKDALWETNLLSGGSCVSRTGEPWSRRVTVKQHWTTISVTGYWQRRPQSCFSRTAGEALKCSKRHQLPLAPISNSPHVPGLICDRVRRNTRPGLVRGRVWPPRDFHPQEKLNMLNANFISQPQNKTKDSAIQQRNHTKEKWSRD